MNIDENFVCPETQGPLHLVVDSSSSGSQFLENENGRRYPFIGSIPDLTFPVALDPDDENTRSFYDNRADDYDKYLHLTFFTHNEDEIKTRSSLIDLLNISPSKKVLDLACGTGRDSELIAERLGPNGELVLQDIAPAMLSRCCERLAHHNLNKRFCIANAMYLPYENDSFDAVYSFGGLGEFSDIKKCLSEIVRITRVGGKVVVGDESMPPWLRNTDYAKILTTTNPQFAAELPLKYMPVEARDVVVRWVIGGVFYVIEFTVGEGCPTANFDFEIPGPRGGTYKTRYYGQLEGVSDEAKALAYSALERKGGSMHNWLDKVVREAAQRDLDGDE